MLSGYGTLVSRLPDLFGSCGDQLECFREFVTNLTTQGERLAQAHAMKADRHRGGGGGGGGGFKCALYHVLSQMWFISLAPRPLDFIVHLETMEADLKAMAKCLPLAAGVAPPFTLNAREGQAGSKGQQGEATVAGEPPLSRAELTRRAPDAVAKLVEYLRHDYECLQYPIPSVI